jgi:hypothetical protein
MTNSNLCQACITGEYPTNTGTQLYQLSLEKVASLACGRTYESARTSAPIA